MSRQQKFALVLPVTSFVAILWIADLPVALAGHGGQSPNEPVKTRSTFYPAELRQQIRSAVEKNEWAAQRAKEIVAEAEFWFRQSDEELWGLMFGPTLPRSWHVYSSGFCPACKKSVVMYNWQVNAQQMPWKVRCPHCRALFPTNDFEAYYRSGLNDEGIFDPAKADRSLLFNTQHPDPADPMHLFGVDDGQGYRQENHCWRFVGAYLIYGQWKQLVLGGIRALAAAYLVTNDAAYARKAAILLDRVADLHPRFDFRSQAFIYDVPSYADGYVTVWHDACEEVRLLALCYDAVFEGIVDDPQLVDFLRKQAARFPKIKQKNTFRDIQQNIEDGLIRDPLSHIPKITSNFPRTPFTQATLLAVLGDPASRQQAISVAEAAFAQATAVDGVTGEKGLSGYGAFATNGIANWLCLFDRLDPEFLKQFAAKFPLRETFRFHLDTWIFEQYYPRIGDAGTFASRETRYAGINLERGGSRSVIYSLDPALPINTGWKLLWRLYELTGDVDFVRLLYRENGNTLNGLPWDISEASPSEFQAKVAHVLKEHGEKFSLPSINKENWAVAILRSGSGEASRAVWLDYDAGGGHGHFDALTLGLFAHGLDLLPDFGYPPVQYGGWGSPRARWYISTLSHNTVAIDGQDQRPAKGKTLVWGQSPWAQAVWASCPGAVGQKVFDRIVILVDKDAETFYVVDVFFVTGGNRHDKFIYPHFAQLEVDGRLPPPEPLEESVGPPSSKPHVQVSQWRRLASQKTVRSLFPSGIMFTWQIEDRYKYLPPNKSLRLGYFEATGDAEILSAQAWVVPGFSTTNEVFLPALIIRREKQPQSQELQSSFAGIFVPYAGPECPISQVGRLTASELTNKIQELSGGKPPAETPPSNAEIILEVVFADNVHDFVIVNRLPTPASAATNPTENTGNPAGTEKNAEAIVLMRIDPKKPSEQSVATFRFR